MKLDRKAVRAAIVDGLPGKAHWEVMDHFPIDYDFTIGRAGLHEPTTEMVGKDKEKWTHLLIFGTCDYGNGGAAFLLIGVSKEDGAVYAGDVTRPDLSPDLLNSSIEGFIRTFNLLNEYLDQHKALPLDLELRVREIDPEAYSESDWRGFVKFLQD